MGADMTETVDVIVIGAGQAGPSIASRFAAAGQKVVQIERALVGGTCVNTGCMPTKTLVASARVAHMARRGAEFGINLPGEVEIDMGRVSARAHTVTANARGGLEEWLQSTANIELVRGHAKLVGPHQVEVGGRIFDAQKIFINVGGRARFPDMPGLSDVECLTNTSILGLSRVPKHLVVIGGSYIGLEFAQMYRRFGSQVTVVEQGASLVSREDEDVSLEIKSILEGEGISCRLNAECISFAPHPAGVQVNLDCRTGAPHVIGSDVLLAVGRVPNTDDLGLDRAGIVTDSRGFIVVDDTLQTNVAGVWAVGDCNGKGAFTHTAYNDFEIVTANILDGEQRKVSDRIPGYALYIDPPLGRAGMTEKEARKTGRSLLVSKRPMTKVGRAVERDETQGFMKVIADADTKQILGAAILGVSGDEAIHGLLDIMSARVPYPVLEWAVPIHPTVSELIPTLLRGLKPEN
jgi:pyruvate/2-oxoglutarate dehydrogenase complex dihydrolipoamide dehydrogenase (E3) component